MTASMTAMNETTSGVAPDAALGEPLDIEALGAEMIAAARAAIDERGPALQALAELELRRLAGALSDIASQLASGNIDRERAHKLVGVYQLSVRSVIRTVEGLGLLSSERAMQAVTRVAAAVVNRLVGFKLL